ncbi:MAG: cytochrome P460 family protein [Bacteroidota bacterium]
MTKNKLIFLSITLAVFIVVSCSKDKVNTEDIQLFNKATDTTGFVWFNYVDTLLPKSIGSGHNEPLLRTRYNNIAASQLDSTGKILANAQFPEGSLIVKELYDNTTTIGRYAILFKDSENDFADENGWVWGYINADGSVVESVSKKGNACINCHSQAQNIDYMLMNKYFP